MTFHAPDKYRVKSQDVLDRFGNHGDDKNGVFQVKFKNRLIRIICSAGEGWEHVSVSLPDRCPTWPEMCRIKGLFWDDEDCVIQFHPPKVDYVNVHNYCLHLWRPTDTKLTTPPTWMIA